MSRGGHTSSDDFSRACELWDRGDAKRAYRLFYSLATQGDLGAQVNLGWSSRTELSEEGCPVVFCHRGESEEAKELLNTLPSKR
jgi:hypothetical protein